MKCVLVIEKDGSVRQRIPYDDEEWGNHISV